MEFGKKPFLKQRKEAMLSEGISNCREKIMFINNHKVIR